MDLTRPYPNLQIGTDTCEVGMHHGVVLLADGRTLYSPIHFDREDWAYANVLAWADQWAAHREGMNHA